MKKHSDPKKKIIKREGAKNIKEIEEAPKQKDDILERKLVSQASKNDIAKSLVNLDKSDEKQALIGLYEIFTGDTPGETLQ